MIDIHSHLLPCVDDGSRSYEVTEELLRQYAEQHIGHVICTPHQNERKKDSQTLKQAFAALRERTRRSPVSLYLGAEIRYYYGMVNDLKDGKLLTMNGTDFVLVEFSETVEPADLLEAVYELRLAGYIPIIAHVERYDNLSGRDYAAIRQNGGLIQVNTTALRRSKRKLKYLLKRNLLDFIASDCHDAFRRNVDFTEIRSYISKKYPDRFDKLFASEALFVNPCVSEAAVADASKPSST